MKTSASYLVYENLKIDYLIKIFVQLIKIPFKLRKYPQFCFVSKNINHCLLLIICHKVLVIQKSEIFTLKQNSTKCAKCIQWVMITKKILLRAIHWLQTRIYIIKYWWKMISWWGHFILSSFFQWFCYSVNLLKLEI